MDTFWYHPLYLKKYFFIYGRLKPSQEKINLLKPMSYQFPFEIPRPEDELDLSHMSDCIDWWRNRVQLLTDTEPIELETWEWILEIRDWYADTKTPEKDRQQFLMSQLAALDLNERLRIERINAVVGHVIFGKERQSGEQLTSYTKIDKRVLTLLAVLYSVDNGLMEKVGFHRVIQSIGFDPSGAQLNLDQVYCALDYITALGKNSDSPQVRYQMNLILDFVAAIIGNIRKEAVSLSAQVGAPERSRSLVRRFMHDQNNDKQQRNGDSLVLMNLNALLDTVKDQAQKTGNYLIRAKLRDIDTMRWGTFAPSERRIDDYTEGIGTDASIYRFRNATREYDFRLQYGLFECDMEDNHCFPGEADHCIGLSNQKFVLPIAPGYYALFNGNRVERIYRMKPNAVDQTSTAKECVSSKENNPFHPLYEDLYTELNAESGSVQLTSTIQEFDSKLRCAQPGVGAEKGVEFLFDLERVDTQKTHPVVLDTLRSYNIQVLNQRIGNSKIQLEEVNPQAFLTELYPEETGKIDPGKIYRWKTFASPSVRKKLEDDLEIYIEDYPLWIQRPLQDFLDAMDTDEVSKVRAFLRSGNKKDRVVALSVADFSLDQLLRMSRLRGIDTLLAAYAKNIKMADETAKKVQVLYKEIFPEDTLALPDFFSSIIRRSNRLLAETSEALKPLSSSDEQSTLCQKQAKAFRHENKNITFTAELVATLSREQLRTLDLEKLATIEVYSASVADLPEIIWKPMVGTVNGGFNPIEAARFRKDFPKKPDAKVHYSAAGDEPLSFCGSSYLGHGVHHLSWVSRASDSPISRFTQPTLFTFIVKREEFKDLYAAGKPHVGFIPMALGGGPDNEGLGFVVCGITQPSPGEHQYLRVRRFENEQGKDYRGKRLTNEQVAEIQKKCPKKHQWGSITVDGVTLKVCKVEFIDKTHNDDIHPEDEDGWLLQQVDKLCTNGEWVMSAYIPDEPNTGKTKGYFCVLEPSQIDKEDQGRFDSCIAPFNKKAA